MSNHVNRLASSKRWAFSIAMLLFSASSPLIRADIVIDDFNPALALTVTLPGNGSSNTGTAVGGGRDYFGTKSGLLNASMEASGGLGTLSTDALTTSTGTMQYDGTAGSVVNVFGLGGLDLTQGGVNDQFQLAIGVDRPGFQATLAVWTGGNLFTTNFIVPQGSPTNFFIPFASFGGANFGNVGAIELRLNTGFTPVAEADFSITAFNAIPEPASSCLLILGLGLTSLCRRRKA
jgi:hypothetical protein